MTKGWRIVGIGALIVGTWGAAPESAWAQPSNFGTITLASGFTPDPNVSSGTSGGQVAASSMMQGCQGFISQRPDHILNLRTNFNFLRIFAESGSDTTLVMRGPDGRVTCDDDTFDRNPALQGPRTAGQYSIWVGSYRQGENSAYQLKITELQNIVPGGGGGQVANNAGGPQTQVCGRTVRGNAACVDANAARTNFGCRGGRVACDIRTGFTPDPMKFRLSAGGGRDPIDVSTLNLRDSADNSACGRSFITPRPDFRFTFAAGDRFPLMRFYVITRNGADATLLVNTPDARWRCNDDSYGGRMPTIDFQNPQPGRYDVWVGTYDASRRNPATFHVTELDSNHP
jgi:hypothetical protein